MAFQDTAAQLDAATISRLRTALELGKWPDGQLLSTEQKQTTLEAVMIWEQVHLPMEERTGYLPQPDCGSATVPHSHERIPTVSSDDR
ncbi:MAG: DUF1315 family protein [Natronospirillum sp.]